MKLDEHLILHKYICGKFGRCSDCPINDWVPCNMETPEKELVKYALIAYCKSGAADMQTMGVLSRYLKAVIV